MFTKLSIFDFDKTLVATPEPEVGIPAYEQATGKQWKITTVAEATRHGYEPSFRRSGWWGRPETLEAPILPRPCPPEYAIGHVVQAYRAAVADPDSRNVLMTGRHLKLGNVVKDILAELGLSFHEYYFKGSREVSRHPKYPKNNDTADYKVFMIRDFLMNDQVTHLEIWDDRDDIIERFRNELVPELKTTRPNLKLISIHDVLSPKSYFYPLDTVAHLNKPWATKDSGANGT